MGHRDLALVPLDPRRLWAVDLDAVERSVLDAAFRRDPELPRDVGYAFAGLVELGVAEVFVRALVRRLQEAPSALAPALAVLHEALTSSAGLDAG